MPNIQHHALFIFFVVALSAALPFDDSVTFLPGFGKIEGPKQYAGYATVNSVDGAELFYWFFENEKQKKDAPIVLWFNGGPGCSSQIGLFLELGPFQIQHDLSLKKNKYSWTNEANMLFIDQPVGVGYSYVNSTNALTQNQTLVAEHLYMLLNIFFSRHPEYSKLDLLLTGESYAGKYVPSLAHRILVGNSDPNQMHMNLKGIAIGDALIDPLIQRSIKPDQAYWSGLMSHYQLQQAKEMQAKCIRQIQWANYRQQGGPCNDVKALLLLNSGLINIYDVRRFDPSTNKTALELYLNQPQVQEALHVNHIAPKYISCSKNVVYQSMNSDVLLPVKHLLPYLAKHMKVLLYNGNFDLQDGPVGTEQMLQSLNLPEFNNAPRNLWFVDDQVAGYEHVAHANLTFVVVHGAGHFVPSDQSKHALELLKIFIQQEPFCKPGQTIPLRFSALTPTEVERFVDDPKNPRIPCQISQLICIKVFNNCMGNGDCINGKCVCKAGYVGPTCASPIFAKSTIEAHISGQETHYMTMPGADIVTVRVAFANISMSQVAPVDEFNLPRAVPNVGNGIGVNQPYNKLCMYGKRDGLPSFLDFDFVSCISKSDLTTTWTVPLPKSTTETWNIMLYNGLDGIDFSYTVTSRVIDANFVSILLYLVSLQEFLVIVGILSIVIVYLLARLCTATSSKKKQE